MIPLVWFIMREVALSLVSEEANILSERGKLMNLEQLMNSLNCAVAQKRNFFTDPSDPRSNMAVCAVADLPSWSGMLPEVQIGPIGAQIENM